ncbi:MAG TPA: cupin domain-containing protein [Crenotrichaceae bacterium]|nr:cupin domain-containing protein [Crenotrichaceae bacterium]
MRLIKELISTANTRVAEFSVDPDETGQWHYHSDVIEFCYCLEGVIRIDQKNTASMTLHPGEKLEIAIGNVHRVCSIGTQCGRYLVVQGPGVYDFVQV